MTVRELRNILDDIEDDNAEIVIYTSDDGSEIITEIELDEYEPIDDDDDLLEEGTIIIRPVDYL